MAAVANVPQQVNAAALEQPAQVRSSSFLSTKVWRAVSVIFETLAMVSFLVVLGVVLAGNLPTLHLLTAMVLLSVAKSAAGIRYKLHDFENPEELQRLRAAAPHMSYTELRREFKWADVKQYQLLPIEGDNGLRKKVLLHLADSANLSYFQGIFGRREMQSLLEHGIIDVEIAQAIRGDNRAMLELLIAPEAIRAQMRDRLNVINQQV